MAYHATPTGLTTQECTNLLLSWDNILILTHRRPDGDTVGCGIALCLALRQAGKTAWLMKNLEATEPFATDMAELVAPEAFSPSYVVTVDTAATSLFPKGGEVWLERGIDLAIDHHPSYEGFGKESCVNPTRAACGEIIYEIVSHMGDMTKEIALPLYVAISTDTGCFMYSNTTPNTHRVAADLMATGIDFFTMNLVHFQYKSLTRMRLESAVLNEMDFYDHGEIAIATLSLAQVAQFGATKEDTSELSSLPGQISGVQTAVTIKEDEGGFCKISVRTMGGLNANLVCSQIGGGGHAAASGGIFKGTLQETKEALLKAIRVVQQG